MKKIKKKTGKKKSRILPTFVIGYSHTDAPPPGYLAAWFNQTYGGPLHIHFTDESGHSQFEAAHTTWRAGVNTALLPETAETWEKRLQWSHSQLAEVIPLQNVGQDKRDVVLHIARIARGLTLLTEGTAYDLLSHSFLNPSDWNDRPLDHFDIENHVRVEQKEQIDSCQTWFYTLGLAKFGLEEIETFRPLGLSEQPTIDRLMDIGAALLDTGKVAKVGQLLALPQSKQLATVVRHRTDQSTGRVLQLREVKW